MANRWFEDFEVGQVFATRGVTVTEAGIIDFALRYDPQRFHTDVEAAARTPFGGLIASGLHTLSLAARLFLDLQLLERSGIGAPGIETLAWTAPVRPGDTLRVEAEVLETVASRSKPGQGTVRIGFTTVNQRGETVMRHTIAHLVRRRGEDVC